MKIEFRIQRKWETIAEASIILSGEEKVIEEIKDLIIDKYRENYEIR